MSIRQGEAFDGESIFRISAECFPKSWSEQAYTEDLKREDSVYLLFETEGEIQGFIGARKILDELEITNVAVRDSYQNKGIGTKLTQALKEWCQKEEIKRITLEVRESNKAAQKVYCRVGFEHAGIRKNYYTHPVENAYIMIYELS